MGWAAFIEHTGALVACGLNGHPWVQYPSSKAVIEMPSEVDSRASGLAPETLLKLAFKAGKAAAAIEARGGTYETFYPREWKGSVSKDIHNARVIRALPPACAAVAARDLQGIAASYQNNVIDAIGLGKWYWARIERKSIVVATAAPPRLPGRVR